MDKTTLRICKVCKVEKQITNFYRGHNGCYRTTCKKCSNKAQYIYQQTKGKEKYLVSEKKYRSSDKCKATARRLRQTIKGRYGYARKSARNRDLPFEFSLEEYAILLSMTCTYCQSELLGSGISLDRINSYEGYVHGNVVPCCGECNRIKSDIYTYDEMIRIIGPAIARVIQERSQEN